MGSWNGTEREKDIDANFILSLSRELSTEILKIDIVGHESCNSASIASDRNIHEDKINEKKHTAFRITNFVPFGPVPSRRFSAHMY